MEEKNILEKISDEKGIISVSDAEKNGINRFRLSYLAREDIIDRVSHGLYALKNEIIDEYALIQNKSDKLIFSYHTALYFHDLSDRVPSQIHITLPQGYNASRLKKRHDNLIVHYVKEEVLELGKEKGQSPLGNEILLYDVERCICDLIKDKNKIDPQIFTAAIKRYFSEEKVNTRKLIKYAGKLKVEDKVRKYIEVLTWYQVNK